MHFCELAARLSWAKSDEGSMVPWKMALYWFMPALVKSSVGSDSGTTEDEGTAACQLGSFLAVSAPAVPTKGVAPLLEVVQEGLAHFGGSPLGLFLVRHGCGLRACEEGYRGGGARSECVLRRERASGREAARAGLWSSASQCSVTQMGSSQSCGEHHQIRTAGAAAGQHLQMNGGASTLVLEAPRNAPVNINTKQRPSTSTPGSARQHQHQASPGLQQQHTTRLHVTAACCRPETEESIQPIVSRRDAGCDGWRQS